MNLLCKFYKKEKVTIEDIVNSIKKYENVLCLYALIFVFSGIFYLKIFENNLISSFLFGGLIGCISLTLIFIFVILINIIWNNIKNIEIAKCTKGEK